MKQSSPIDQTPCITIDDTGGVAVFQKHITTRKVDQEMKQVLQERKNATVQIHVWCDSEKEREEINNQIMTLFYQMQTDHYMFCTNYEEGVCKYLETACPSIDDSSNMRTSKNQCPNPKEYGYCNLFKKYHIIRNTFNLEPPFSLDDLTTTRPTLHSVFKCTMTYHTYYTIGGNTIQDIIFNEELL